jgi:hypothetical protein
VSFTTAHSLLESRLENPFMIIMLHRLRGDLYAVLGKTKGQIMQYVLDLL